MCFGNGPRLFIDNYGEAEGTIETFKAYLEDARYLKVFHNWGFDRHIFFNHAIDVRGFGADTLHMARLLDSSQGPGSYSLAKLTEQYETDIADTKAQWLHHFKERARTESQLDTLETYERFHGKIKKVNIRQSFGFFKTLRNGNIGKVIQYPDLEEQHTNPIYIEDWVEYACFDAEITYFLLLTLR